MQILDEVLQLSNPQAQLVRKAQVMYRLLKYADKHGFLDLPEWMPWADEQMPSWNDNGWTLFCSCDANGPPNDISNTTNTNSDWDAPGCSSAPCITSGFVRYHTLETRIGFVNRSNPTSIFADHVRSYQRSFADAEARPGVRPEYVPARKPVYLPAVPIPFPQLDPETLPIQQPVVDPKPLPWPAVKLKPKVNPSYKAGNGDPTRPGQQPHWPPTVEPAPGTETEVKPEPGPGEPKALPGGSGIPTTPVDFHPLNPPGRREKERKEGVMDPRLNDILRRITDGEEIVDAAYGALEQKCGRARDMTVQAKAKCIYTNINSLNIPKFLLNLAENEIEDRVIGSVAKRVRKHQRNVIGNRPVGVQSGWSL